MNKYIEQMRQVAEGYANKTNRILSTMRETAKSDAIQHLQDAYKTQELDYLVQSAKEELLADKKEYIEKCRELINKDLPKVAPKIKNEDLNKIELLMLGSSLDENIDKIKGQENEEDFKLIKGIATRIALLEGDKEAIKQIRAIKQVSQEQLQVMAMGQLNQEINNNSFIQGCDIGTQLLIKNQGLEQYLYSQVEVTQDNFK